MQAQFSESLFRELGKATHFYQFEKNKRAMGVRVPIEGPLDYGKFPLSEMPKTKKLLADADNILGWCYYQN